MSLNSTCRPRVRRFRRISYKSNDNPLPEPNLGLENRVCAAQRISYRLLRSSDTRTGSPEVVEMRRPPTPRSSHFHEKPGRLLGHEAWRPERLPCRLCAPLCCATLDQQPGLSEPRFPPSRMGVPLQAGRRLGPRASSVLGAMALTSWVHSGATLRCPQRGTEAHATPGCTGAPRPVGGGQGGRLWGAGSRVIGLSHLQTINVDNGRPCQSPTTGCNCPLYLPLPFIKTATEPADKQDNYM